MVVIFIWKKLSGVAFFFVAVGVVLGYFISGVVEFLVVVILLLMAYIFSFRC
jgi:hypothetical protein